MGQQIKGQDAKGTYFAVVAGERNGNPGGGGVIFHNGFPPKFLSVDADSYWTASNKAQGAHLGPDGNDLGGGLVPRPNPGPKEGFPLPSAPAFSLIGFWELDDIQGHLTPQSGLFSIGNGGRFDVPQISLVQGGITYDLHIRYLMNDDDYSDNDGYIHVHESWHN